MSDTEINKAIAEACGLDTKQYQVGGVFCYRDKNGHMRASLPNYCTDLNAMHEVEKTLDNIGKRKFAMALHEMTDAGATFGRGFNYWMVIHTTALQRAIAYVKVIGKWKESEV